ncbi:MAG TPA: 5-deoxy-glucuronate isomerase [Anaerovoracaceae bacterium]|nr:5-deoxy-glucuronate isomerase [Anaerovoracaceae bacterium]
MLIKLKQIDNGYNEITNMETRAQDMLMDIGIQKIEKGQGISYLDHEKETAFLLLSGEISIAWEERSESASRNSLFDENPSVLHVPKDTQVHIKSINDAEILIQKTANSNFFDARFYWPIDCVSEILGENVWNDMARRIIRTVFDYKNAPYSNMVLGEVINYPGKWSSYIPHGHAQPEVYFYRFNRENGFGAGFIGDDVYKIENDSALCIQGGPTHPQVTAPGYAMYYCWMIRHLKENPWIGRTNDDRYEWLLEKDVKIWPDK